MLTFSIKFVIASLYFYCALIYYKLITCKCNYMVVGVMLHGCKLVNIIMGVHR